MTHPSLIERITRSLAYMLRHRPDEFDLELDRHGYGDLEDVVDALNERIGEAIEKEDVVEAIAAGGRVRYEIVDEGIRALYGHSIDVDPGEPTKPPERLYIGVSERDGERAARSGLAGGRRNFLHLALTEEDAIETGRRAGRRYVTITVHALDAWEQDVNFYDRRSLFLSDPIPTDCLEVGDVRDDGREPPERGGRRGRSGRDRGRGRGRDRDRDRGRGRGRGGDGDRERPAREDRRPDDRGEPRRRPEEREERRPHREAPPEPAPAAPEQPAAPSGFGLGIFEPAAVEPEPEPARAPAPAPEPPAEPVVAAEPEPEPEPEASDSGSSAGGFGAGL
ncbi:MAG: RNA 2'-phosphotransferase [Planctomycetota bacterium]|jgi:putative RNA 2'-phosphotransferase|nr:RNA 2'-phosphotransferase [Planctomycetota bacterium]MDP6763984.1 RNA 2'-phosphotransferase [Planctomycetota bacterium]